MQANFYALAAIALWSTLAATSLLLASVPPFLLTGIALVAGSVLSWPSAIKNPSVWRVAWPTLCLGVATLFGFHFFLFLALRMAPSVEVNLVNYVWPLLIVVLSPLYLPSDKLRPVHVLAAALGFAGAALAILGGSGAALGSSAATAASATSSFSHPAWAYLLALASAFLWANYSLQTKRLALADRSFPAAAIGLFGLVSGLLSLLCHGLLEPAVRLGLREGLLMGVMGLGPLGAAFLLWDKALKLGDARQIGILSYLTPLASTVLLLVVTQRALSWHVALAAALIVGAAILGTQRRP